ncbi:MAG TPA: 50S ribosomal protein L7/L12 [Candidatus Absconditabacterales bacterium]|nr:50S ribosomal protein L7/L12 [Candidatus Absconditabacterales bacterium]HOQ78910.1 50S ribosomal protein L7/L12 [Candidatus Absconditabacterales bacterium]HPK27949.1 50S ribosomal protein L7/L12 [Candidatus Absconditabacterales bacterium]
MELSKNAQKIMELVKEMSAIELNELVKAFEEEFGVTATATVVATGSPAGGDATVATGGDVAANIELTEIGQQKINVIKVVKELLGLGLKEAKDLVEKAPVILKENAKDDEVESFKIKLQEAGATVTIK